MLPQPGKKINRELKALLLAILVEGATGELFYTDEGETEFKLVE